MAAESSLYKSKGGMRYEKRRKNNERGSFALHEVLSL
jgi:hypothetical protein